MKKHTNQINWRKIEAIKAYFHIGCMPLTILEFKDKFDPMNQATAILAESYCVICKDLLIRPR